MTSSVAVPALTRQLALGPLLSRVVNDEDLAVLSVVLEQMDDLDDVARLRQTCRVLRDGVDACMMMKRTVVGEGEKELWLNMDIPCQLMAWKQGWTRDSPWATWVARGDMRRERPDMKRALSRCDLPAVRVGKERKWYLLHVASYCGHVGMVMLLLGCGVDKDKAGDSDGVTPLSVACFHGHLEVVRLLVEKGADKNKANNDGITPLFIASQEGHLEIVRLLIDAGADMDKANRCSSTPLFIASHDGHLEIVRLLVDAGADKDKAENDGATPLYIASHDGHLEIVRLLIEAGADMVKAVTNGATPLWIASQMVTSRSCDCWSTRVPTRTRRAILTV